jgi:hypothetical protein
MGKPKKVLFELISPEQVYLSGQPYELLAEVRAENHFDTAEAKIALAWRKGTKPNADGKLVLGRCVKANDLQRELVDYDFVIVLNKEFWEDPGFNREKKIALLDHELCHAAVAVDSDGEKMRDTKGRNVWRVRGHDVEEFEEIVVRHGVWKRDLERFAEAIAKRKKSPLFSQADALRADGEKLVADSPAFLAAADRLASSVRTGGIDSITISAEGMEPVVIDKAAAEKIHRAAKKKT